MIGLLTWTTSLTASSAERSESTQERRMALSVSWWRMKASSFSQYPRLSESYRI